MSLNDGKPDAILERINQCKLDNSRLSSAQLIDKIALLTGMTAEQVIEANPNYLQAGWLALYCRELHDLSDNENGGDISEVHDKNKLNLVPRKNKTCIR